MHRWDIYRAYINFEDDNKLGKKRPILIINVSSELFIACKITSKYRDDELEYEIKDWVSAGLDRQSYIRLLHKVYLPPETQMIYLGSLQKVDIDNIKTLCLKYDIKLNENFMEERLIQSSSNKALQQNIKTEIDSGKSPKQAAAIAYSILRKNESMENKLNKQDILNWLEEHELAWEDFVNYFEDIYQSSAEVPMDEIMGWISEHDDLAMDFENRFGISVYADVYDDTCDWFEDELEEGLFDNVFKKDKRKFAVLKNSEIANIFETEAEAKNLVDRNNSMFSDSEWEFKNIKDLDSNKVKAWLAQDKENSKRYNDFLKQQAKETKHGKETWVLKDGNSKRVVYKFDTEEALEDFLRKQPQSQQIRLHKDKIYESVEGKWNIGSNKLVSTDSQEYANLVDLAKLLQERSPNGYEYRVEKTYEDFGAGMQWYTIICDEKNGWGTHQVLSPREWIYLANTGDIEGTYEEVVSDKYFQDTVEKGKTTTLFNYMDSLED